MWRTWKDGHTRDAGSTAKGGVRAKPNTPDNFPSQKRRGKVKRGQSRCWRDSSSVKSTAALPEDLGSVPIIHIQLTAVSNSSGRRSDTLTQMHMGQIRIQILKRFILILLIL